MSMERILCEVRFEEDETRLSPGRMVGTLATYGERAGDRPEFIRDGGLLFPPTGIVINRQHVRSSPILRALPIIDGKVVRIDSPLLNTTAGRDAAEEMRGETPLLTGLSVEMYVRNEGVRNGMREIISAYVPRAGLVDSPSYKDSLVELRQAEEELAELERLAYLWL